MTVEEIKVGKFTFTAEVERIVDVKMSQSLYKLLKIGELKVPLNLYDSLRMEEMGNSSNNCKDLYCKTNRVMFNIDRLLENVEKYSITEEDVEVLKACKTMFDNHIVDAINFIEIK